MPRDNPGTSSHSSLFPLSSGANTQANCASRNAMAYWRASNGLCKCGSSPNPGGILDFSFNPYVPGNPGECGNNYESYVITTYGFLGCANDVQVSNAVSSSSSILLINPFRTCDPATQIMAFKYGTPSRTRWTAYCFSPTNPPNVAEYDPVQCSGSSYFLYGPNPGPQPSARAVSAKRAAARRDADLAVLAHPWCPAGTTPCQVDEDESLGYECVDTDSELAQCGGCAIGEFGLNGSNVTGVDCGDRATCSAGKCLSL